MTPDSNGILYLEETDPITPFQTTINALQAATSNILGALVADTGWINCVYASGFEASTTTGPLQARMRGGVVFLRGGATGISGISAGSYTNIAFMPPEIPNPASVQRAPAAATSGRVGITQVNPDGTIHYAHYLSSAPTWVQASMSYIVDIEI